MATTSWNDPLLSQQWHLINTGQNGGTAGIDLNIATAWQDYTGKGVVVAVADDGVEYDHPDIAGNINTSLSFSGVPGGADGQPVQSSDMHGMAVAGIIGAVANNGLGGVGVAPEATLASVYVDLSGESEAAFVSSTAAAINAAATQYDIINNSWGNSNVYTDFRNATYAALGESIENAATNGRNGKGTAIIFSAGNERVEGDDSTASNITGSIYAITVAAIDNTGKVSSYSTPGSCILVGALANTFSDNASLGDIVTTDRVGTAGYNTNPSPQGDYAYDFGGTSAAAPEVSGVVALMLEANADLGYRDIQQILALTARNTDATGSWTTNGAGTWNGGGMHVSRDVGYGLVDATAAVRLAETWQTTSTNANMVTTTGQTTVTDGVVPDGTGSVLTTTITLGEGVDVEHMVAALDLSAEDTTGLTITLTSPTGTSSILLEPTQVTGAFPSGFSLSSTAFLGESSAGTWTLTVSDSKADSSIATLTGWNLTAYGSTATANDTWLYTNEYSTYAGSGTGRQIISDTSGNDTINAAAVTSASTIVLSSGSDSVIDGIHTTIDSQSTIENVYTGDGNDAIADTSGNNTISAGRGLDVIVVSGGTDSIDGGAGTDVVCFSGLYTDYRCTVSGGTVYVTGNGVSETITNVELLHFAGGYVKTSSLVAAFA